MQTSLYPFLFEPIFKEKIWGGRRLETVLGKDLGDMVCCGESWELSGLIGDESVIANGFLAENNLNEVMEIYLTDIVGEKNYEKYGLGFPLLIKFIDAHDNLSVQVHPDDELASQKYGQNGKTEMWYVVDAEEGAGLYVGFKHHVTPQQYQKAVEDSTLSELMRFYPVKPGDTFMIPAGTIHAIGKGVLVAEIQQPSDVTFRIYDWDRLDDEGNPRELHTEEALEAIHFDENTADAQVHYTPKLNRTVELVRSPYFTTSLLLCDAPIKKSYGDLDSFVIYMCLDGDLDIVHGGGRTRLKTGDVTLVPAAIDMLTLEPARTSSLLEIHC
ncbi:MAG: class I mannose-6-phosphate isomerase [Bacteroidales bacterium]|nr:class I mannose-6-phosphate isomerase [Bacteroidales bacterium]